eukprot:3229058-Rhodomonas_salina.1
MERGDARSAQRSRERGEGSMLGSVGVEEEGERERAAADRVERGDEKRERASERERDWELERGWEGVKKESLRYGEGEKDGGLELTC